MSGLARAGALAALRGWLAREIGWLALLAAAAIAAAIYVAFSHLRADRDALLEFARTRCAAAGESFDARGRERRGARCGERIANLAEFERRSFQVTAELLARADAERAARAAADANADAANRLNAAANDHRMEAENAKIADDDRVGGDWFAVLGRVAGMRDDAKPTR